VSGVSRYELAGAVTKRSWSEAKGPEAGGPELEASARDLTSITAALLFERLVGPTDEGEGA
jgi:hypothetical protein